MKPIVPPARNALEPNRGLAWFAAGACLAGLLLAGCGTQDPVDAWMSGPATAPPPPRQVGEDVTWSQAVRLVREGLRDRLTLATPVESGMLAELRDLPGLRALHLDGGGVSDDDLLILVDHPGLEELVIRRSSIGNRGLQHIGTLAGLRILNLPHADFDDQGLQALAGLPRLELLRFGSPRVTAAGLEVLLSLPRLKSLHTIDIPLTDSALPTIARLSQLESFYADGARFRDEGMVELFHARKELHIHLDQAHHDLDPTEHRDERPTGEP